MKRPRFTIPAILGLSALVTSPGHSAVTIAAGQTFSTSAPLVTVNPDGQTFAAGLRDNRILRQSFTVDSAMTVTGIQLGVAGSPQTYNAANWSLRIFQITNPNSSTASDWDVTVAPQVGNTLTFAPGSLATSTNANALQIDLTGSDVFNLAAGGYFIALTDLDGNPTTSTFNWDIQNANTGSYAGGRFFQTSATNLDASLALVPEPSTALLGGLGLLGLLRRRRQG